MMLVLGGLQIALGRGLMLSRRTILTTIAFGACILVMSFGYLSSVFYISVSLAVLLLYTYPLMVGIASPLLGRERMTWVKALCLIGAFAGLVVASSEGFGALDWRGIAFALAAAGSLAFIALWGGSAMSRAHPFVMNAWMNFMGGGRCRALSDAERRTAFSANARPAGWRRSPSASATCSASCSCSWA